MAGGRPNKIRASGNEGLVRKLASEGKSYRDIAAELGKIGVVVSYGAVGRFITEESQERRELVRSVATAQAFAAVPLVTQKLRKWVERIDAVADRIMDGLENIKDPEEQRKAFRGVSGHLSTLVGAGTKAGKTLVDITAGEGPTDQVSALRGEIEGILAAKQKRESEPEED